VSCFGPDGFTTMLEGADAVVVTSVDATHAHYVCAALDAGVDVVMEKPLTTDAEGCAAIAAAPGAVPPGLSSPSTTAIRRGTRRGLLPAPAPGPVVLRRAVGAQVPPHFDLVNWWLDAGPELVFAQADLLFYGGENARRPGLGPRPARGTGAPSAGTDPFLLDMSRDERLARLHLYAEHEDG
jgi:hypothetical protein